MYHIFKDLSVQLELESIINRKVDKTFLAKGGVSIIDLVDKLLREEMEYLKLFTDNPKIVQELIDCQQQQAEKVSESFGAIFKKQVGDDKKDLQEVMKNLEEQTNMTIWKALDKDRGKEKAVNIFQEIILQKMKNAANDELREELQKKTLLEIKADFILVDRIRVFFSTTPLLKLFTVFFLFATFIGAVALWEKYGQIMYAKVSIPFDFLTTSLGILYNDWRKGVDYATECSKQFSDKVKTAQGIVEDVESAYANGSSTEIQPSKSISHLVII